MNVIVLWLWLPSDICKALFWKRFAQFFQSLNKRNPLVTSFVWKTVAERDVVKGCAGNNDERLKNFRGFVGAKVRENSVIERQTSWITFFEKKFGLPLTSATVIVFFVPASNQKLLLTFITRSIFAIISSTR